MPGKKSDGSLMLTSVAAGYLTPVLQCLNCSQNVIQRKERFRMCQKKTRKIRIQITPVKSWKHYNSNIPIMLWAAGMTGGEARNTDVAGLAVTTVTADEPALLFRPLTLRPQCLEDPPANFPRCLCFLSSKRRCKWSCNRAPCRPEDN